MNPRTSPPHQGTSARPQKLFRYAQRAALERSLQFGEFLLEPPRILQAVGKNEQILPFGPSSRSAAIANYLALSFSKAWDEKLFDVFGMVDCCLVIHDTEQFGERIHRATQRLLPSWAGIDAAVSYGTPSPLGAMFSRDREQAAEKEWLFAWRPTQRELACNPIVISIGNIEEIAELRSRAV